MAKGCQKMERQVSFPIIAIKSSAKASKIGLNLICIVVFLIDSSELSTVENVTPKL